MSNVCHTAGARVCPTAFSESQIGIVCSFNYRHGEILQASKEEELFC
jgi:hypothetical protein